MKEGFTGPDDGLIEVYQLSLYRLPRTYGKVRSQVEAPP
jgi:hypothetical protein